MLQLETLPASLAGLLWVFRPCFTAPTFRTFAALVAGLVKLRRTLIAARFRAGTARQPTPQETLAVHQAWAEAAA